MKKVVVKPGFLLLLGVLLYLDEGVGMLPAGLGAAVLHEGGHYLFGRLYGGGLRRLELSAVGAGMELEYQRPLSYLQEIAVTLAGPAVNLLLGWLGMQAGWFLFASVNLGLAALNLLPVLPLDGGRVLWSAVTYAAGEEWGSRVVAVVSAVFVGGLIGVGAVAALHFANVSLLIVSFWLFWMVLIRKK